jgi:WD40 repeat protein
MANNHCLLSASLDGTVRAWDLYRYRNFRTFTTPSSRQFVSLAADQSGEVICAGTLDSFEVLISFAAALRPICCIFLFFLTECLIFVFNRYLFGQ